MLEKYENASDFYNSITYTESVMLYILCLCRVFKDKLISIEKVKEDYSMRYRLTFETKAGRTFQSCVFVKDSPPAYPGEGGAVAWLDAALTQYTGQIPQILQGGLNG